MCRDDQESAEMSKMPTRPVPIFRHVASGNPDGGAKEKAVPENASTARKRAGVNFTNILRAPFSYESLLSSFSVDKLRFKFFLAKGYWRKSCS